MAKKAESTSTPSEPGLRIKGVPVRAKPVGAALLAIAAVWFIAANTESVQIHLWIPTVTAPLWVVLVACLLVGMVLGWFLARRSAKRRGRA